MLTLIKQGVIFVVGFFIILIGFILLFIPGPGLLVIAAGIAVLATEFVWARQWIDFAKVQFQKYKQRKKNK